MTLLATLSAPTGAEDELRSCVLFAAGVGRRSPTILPTPRRRASRALAATLDCSGMRALIDELERDDADGYWSSGCARAQVIGVEKRGAIGMLALAAAWETSGATAGALGVALHLTATASFGLTSETLAQLRRDAPSDAFARGHALHARHAEALRFYLERQYDETQMFLSGATVAVYRGASIDATSSGRFAMTLRPLSSFALTRDVAAAFPCDRPIPCDRRHALIAAQAPASRILSTPVTGMASHWEHEVVVLGAAQPSDCVDLDVAPPGERVV